MKVEQFVMAYGVEQDRLRAILPDGFASLRPVLRINAEVRDERTGYVEFNTAVEKDGVRGWLNIGYWDAVPFTREGKTLPAYPTEVSVVYPKEDFTVENAAKIPCRQVLGTYTVRFER